MIKNKQNNNLQISTYPLLYLKGHRVFHSFFFSVGAKNNVNAKKKK